MTFALRRQKRLKARKEDSQKKVVAAEAPSKKKRASKKKASGKAKNKELTPSKQLENASPDLELESLEAAASDESKPGECNGADGSTES